MRFFVYYDTSGSVTDELLQKFKKITEEKKLFYKEAEWYEYCFDTNVLPIKEFNSSPRVCGGTSPEAVWNHFTSHAKPEDGFILLSDGLIPKMKKLPGPGIREFIFIEE